MGTFYNSSSETETMLSVVETFINANRRDDQQKAFTRLRSFVKNQKNTSSFSSGLPSRTMSQFLQVLVDFGEQRKLFSEQIVEVVKELENHGEEDWQRHIDDSEIRAKLSRSTSRSDSLPCASTSSNQVLPAPPVSKPSSSEENPPDPLLADLKKGNTVEIVGPQDSEDGNSERFGKLVEHEEGGLWKVELLGGKTCSVPEGHLRRADSTWMNELTFNAEEAAKNLEALHSALLELLELPLVAEADEGRRGKLNEVKCHYKEEYQRMLTDKNLHFVFAGLISTGKTTLVNSLLAYSFKGKWTGEMLPSHALENTAIVTMFVCTQGSDQIRARSEAVCRTTPGDGDAIRYESRLDPSWTRFKSMEELQEKIPGMLKKLASSAEGFKRLIVDIPQSLDFIPDIHRKASGLSPSEVIVDTPGLDSVGLKEHLVSILDEKCYMCCFLVDVNSPSPFGKDGFKVLQFLKQKSQVMFPPVIIFTKMRVLEEAAQTKTWKKANPNGLNGRLKDLVNHMLDKLEAAGCLKPFFAEVDALWASQDIEKESDPDDKEEIKAAQEGLSKFATDLLCLGRDIATPLDQCMRLQLQTQTTQKVINIIHQEGGQRLLEGKDLDDLKQLGETLKCKFSNKVDKYFHVDWTRPDPLGMYEPQPPFNRDTCAICKIPTEFKRIFEGYKEENNGMWDKSKLVQEIAEQTNKHVFDMIVNDLNKYETEAFEALKTHVWVKMGIEPADLEQHLAFLFWQYLLAGSLGAGAILGGLAAGDAAFVAGLVYTGAATAVGMAVFIPIALACVLWMCKDKLGGWTWMEAEQTSWAVVLDACKKNFPKISEHVKNGFSKKVDEILARLEEHRAAPSDSEDSGSGVARIQHSATRGYKDVAKRLQEILLAREDRWLGKKQSILEKICKEVLHERQPKEPQPQEQLHMGAMSSNSQWKLTFLTGYAADKMQGLERWECHLMPKTGCFVIQGLKW